jgi:hypothetical protein
MQTLRAGRALSFSRLPVVVLVNATSNGNLGLQEGARRRGVAPITEDYTPAKDLKSLPSSRELYDGLLDARVQVEMLNLEGQGKADHFRWRSRLPDFPGNVEPVWVTKRTLFLSQMLMTRPRTHFACFTHPKSSSPRATF